MKRVLCIISSLDTGGAETMMMKLFRTFPSEYKMDFIVSASTGFYEKEVLALGGKIYRVPLRTKHPVKTFVAIKKVVQENNYDIVLKLCDTPKGYFDLVAAKWGGAKRICVRSCNASANMGKVGTLICNIIRPLFNKIATVELAPSLLAAEFTFGKKEVSKGNVYILHNGINLNVFQYSDDDRNNIRKEFGILEDEFVVGHVGRFNKQKNHFFLIEVFKELKKIKPNAKLLLVGEGELKSEVQQCLEANDLIESVIFAGIRSDIPNLLSAMDVFLFPSLYEGMPNTIIEAQAVGIPCVIADTITRDANVTGLVKYISLDEPKEKWVNSCINSNKETASVVKKRMTESGYDIEAVTKEFIDIIFD